MTKKNRGVSFVGDSIPSGKRIRQARELSGLTQLQLADKIQVSQGLVAQIEGSFKLAGPELVHRVAIHTRRFHPSFFYQDPPIEFPADAVMFRALSSTTRSEETEARRYSEVVSEMASVLLRHIKPIPLKVNFASQMGPADAARRVRSSLQLLGDQPIGHLIREIEKSGVLVLAMPIQLPKRDALSLWADAIGMPVVALFSGAPGDRVRMSAAHELGHIVLKHSKILKPIEEREAYEFAAELLMPEAVMRREINPPITLSLLAELKAKWRVSIQALLHRAADLGIIDDRRARYLYTQISAKGWRKDEPVEVAVERPRLLRQLAERIYGENRHALANELGFRIEFVNEILACYEAKRENEPIQSTKVISLKVR